MPIFEFNCGSCGNEFETLVRSSSPAAQCPSCHGTDLHKKLSTFSAVSRSAPEGDYQVMDIHVWRCLDEEWEQGPAEHEFRLKAQSDVFDPGFLLGARGNPECDTKGCHYFPREFAFCPGCGKPLPKENGGADWYPPYGSKHGLKLVDQALAVTMDRGGKHGNNEADPVDVPGLGVFVFFATAFAGQATGLFALERQGSLWYRNWESGNWREIVPEVGLIQPTQLPLRRWSAAFPRSGRGSGSMVFPSEAGPQFVKVDPRAGTYHVTQGQGVCLGGGVEFGGFACFPVASDAGLSVGMSRCGEDGNIHWTHVPVSGFEPGSLSSPLEFNAPIVRDAPRRVLWICVDGVLQLQMSSGADSRAEASWISWGSGWGAMLEYGPPFEDNEGLWQHCYNDDDEFGYAYLKVGSKLAIVKKCDSPRLTTGRTAFKLSGRTRLKPWETVREDDPPFCFPLLESRHGSRVLYLEVDIDGFSEDFFETDKRLRVELKLDGNPGALLNAVIARPQDAQCFVYDKWIYFYHPDREPSLVRWRLEDA